MIRRKAEALAATGARDAAHKVPYTTGLTTIVQGGIANNIVPDRCEVEFEFRGIAADDPRASAKPSSPKRAVRSSRDAGGRSGVRDLVRQRRRISGARDGGRRRDRAAGRTAQRQRGVSKVAFGTEAGLFEAMAGIPSVVVGPGSIQQAHKPDEWIAKSELAAASRFVDRLIAHCSAGG